MTLAQHSMRWFQARAGCFPRFEDLRWFLALWLVCTGEWCLATRAADDRPPTAPQSGLVAHLAFDGDLHDRSGFKRHAVHESGEGSARYSAGRSAAANQALHLTGGGPSITLPSLAGFGPNGGRGTTVSLWMRFPIRGFLLGCAREGVPRQSSFHIGVDDQKIRVSGCVGDEVAFGFPESASLWRHLVVVFAPTSKSSTDMRVHVWLDGRSLGSTPIEVNPLQLRTPLTLGGVSGMTQGGLQGDIDDLRLYGKALSSEEVQMLYASDSAGLSSVPVLVLQPQAQTVEKGREVTFRVAVRNDASCTYQWQLNQTNLSGATGPELTLTNVTPSLDGGRYRVLVQNASGAVFSEAALLTVFPLAHPSILAQPVSVEVAEGEPEVVFEVAAAGSGHLVYQWQFNGKNLPQGNSERLVLRHVRPFADGRYRVRVTNAYGSTWSDEVTLSVNTFDADEDGLTDYEELLLKTDPEKPDFYGDRLPLISVPESGPWDRVLGGASPTAQGSVSLAVAMLQTVLRVSHFWWLEF